MAEELALCERAVFSGSVFEGLRLLDRLPPQPQRAAAHAMWLRGVALGAYGRYGPALEAADAIPEGIPEFSMAQSLRGSLLRQIGCHDLALEADQAALADAATSAAAVEALTGLAADAVGLHDPPTAARMLQQAGRRLAEADDDTAVPGWWRSRVRLDWVRCEVALMESRYPDAVVHARAALEVSQDVAAARHAAKSMLFLAVSELENGRRELAPALLRDSLALSTPRQVLAVAWPAHTVLASLLGDVDPAGARSHYARAAAIIDIIGESLTGDLARRWAGRADLAAVKREAS